MGDRTMPLVTLRPKGQVTIPTQILQQWDIKPYQKLEVAFHNGVLTIIPALRKEPNKKKTLHSFAGAGRGCWGETPEEVKQSITNLRDSWTR